MKFLKFDFANFSFIELCKDSNGKTDAVLFSGLIICMTGCISFTIAATVIFIDTIFKVSPNNDVLSSLLTQTIVFTGIGAGLLTAHRVSKDKQVLDNDVQQTLNNQ